VSASLKDLNQRSQFLVQSLLPMCRSSCDGGGQKCFVSVAVNSSKVFVAGRAGASRLLKMPYVFFPTTDKKMDFCF